MKKYSFIIAGILVIGIAAVAYASILFTGTLTVSNNGTAASEVCTIFSINASYLQDTYGVDDEFDNVKILNSAGENVTFMPGYGSNPWLIFVPSIGEYTTTSYEFYTGNTSLDGKKAIFLNDSMTITDDISMECGDLSFNMTISGYIDTSTNGVIVDKNGANDIDVTSNGTITWSSSGYLGATLSATGIPTGEHDILIYNDPITTRLYIDDDLKDDTSSALVSIPNNANDWTIGSSLVSYIDLFELQIVGSGNCTIPWSYGATLEDQSGNGNDATPTFRTTSSDADVSAELTEYLPYAEADADAVPIGYGTMFDEAPEQPETAYSENTSPGLFFAPAINSILDATSIPRSFFWYNFSFFIIIMAGMVTWRIHQSLILKAMVMTAFMILFALPGINIYGMYTVIYFSFFNFGLIIISRSWGL